MRIEYGIASIIDDVMVKRNEADQAKHTPSGKLSAGMLHQPLRFQLLKYLGVPPKEMNTFTLRKLARGKQVEKWFVDCLKEKSGLVIDTQLEVEYRNTVGKPDIEIDQNLLTVMVGEIPHEVKSVTNKAFKYIQKDNISFHYKLQAGFYGLARGTEEYGLDFIASDDLRDRCFILETKEIKPYIDQAIDDFQYMISHRTIPEWEVQQEWQNNPEYMKYDPIWATCTESEFRSRLEQLRINY